ncbi:hypothetical protein [Nannocystis pusilla]|uniref:hypothetical protein n=1 Tax=Nannocystis pusilla TaxID=889268 RepID=UPI003B76DB43
MLDLFTRARQAPIQDPFRTPSPPDPHDERPRVTGRTGLLLAICQQARTRYRERTGGDLRPGAILRLLRYAHAYALEEGRSRPTSTSSWSLRAASSTTPTPRRSGR